MVETNETIRQKVKIKCPNCNYEWASKSILLFITCPNCQNKFRRIK
jgi:Zn finger protein HypA/HybF involved in hydrogenase expression